VLTGDHDACGCADLDATRGSVDGDLCLDLTTTGRIVTGGNATMIIASKVVKRVVTIDENKFVSDAAQLMTKELIGSVVVTDASGICGLLTEREVMMTVVGKGKDPKKVLIKDVITRDHIKVSPNDTAGACLDLMKEHRCLHLLVFEGDEFVGTASLRDVAELMIDQKETLIQHLEKYITS
jgi:CBS domain-containing protein